MDTIGRYMALVDNNKWNDAIPLIKEIINRDPEIDTSWFNYGICLDEIGKHNEAADAFIKAHELNETAHSIQSRIIRSLSLAEDYHKLHGFIDYLCQTFADGMETIFESEEFTKLSHRNEFLELKAKYYVK